MIYFTHRHPVRSTLHLDIRRVLEISSAYQHIMNCVHWSLDGRVLFGEAAMVSANSPDVLWASISKQHYDWLFDCWSQGISLCHKYDKPLKDISERILSLSRSPSNLLNHGWSSPYSPDTKPYRGSAEETWKRFLLDNWNMESPKWPYGVPDWIEYNNEQRKWLFKRND